MVIPDANVLIYAVNSSTRQHESAHDWLDNALAGSETVGFDWIVLLAFIRVTTRSGIMPNPLDVQTALGIVEQWTSAPPSQMVHPTVGHLGILRGILEPAGTGGNLTSDAHLAALAIEHGAELHTFDRDFGRFAGLRWHLLGADP